MDWVFLVFRWFEVVVEVVFVVDEGEGDGEGEGGLERWWGCVRDAVREAASSREVKMGRQRSRGIWLSVEYGEWRTCEEVLGC